MSTVEQLSEEKKKPFNVKLIKKGIFYFLTISIITMIGIFLYTNTGNTIEVWKDIEVKYIVIAAFIMFLDLLIGGWRNHIFAREFNPDISPVSYTHLTLPTTPYV